MKRYIEISKSKEMLGRGEIAFIFSAIHCVKRVHIRSFSGPLFPAFGLNTERYEVSLCIQSESGKIRTRKTPNMDTSHAIII